MMINASTAKQLSDDANRYDVYRKIIINITGESRYK